MYMIFKNNRPVGNIKFASYEKARQHARKIIRKKFYNEAWLDWSADRWGTPTLGFYDYSIRQV